MTIEHHPAEDTLMAYASGTLSEANAVVVATHLMHCVNCRADVRNYAAIGGALIEDAPQSALTDTARSGIMRRIDAERPASPPAPQTEKPDPVATETEMARGDSPFSLYPADRWRWIGPGIYRRMIDVPDLGNEGTRVFLLKAAPGTRLPDHTHTGSELTCVLEGAFRHEHGRFGPGDFEEADDDIAHTPVVEAGVPCICLVAMQGTLILRGPLGKLLQPFVRL